MLVTLYPVNELQKIHKPSRFITSFLLFVSIVKTRLLCCFLLYFWNQELYFVIKIIKIALDCYFYRLELLNCAQICSPIEFK